MAFPGGFDTARRRRVALVLLWLLLLAAWSSPVESSPLTKPEVLKLIRKSVQEMRLLAVVRELGVDFKVTFEVADELRAAGASPSLIAALRVLASPAESFAPAAPAPPAPPPPPASSPEPPPLQPVAAPPPPAPPPVPVTPPQPPPPAPPPATASASPPPASSVGSERKDPAPPEGDPPPRDEGPPPALEPPPPAPLPRGALETMVALIPGPPPPPPPPVLGATAGLAESPVPSPPSEPPAPVPPVPVVTLAPAVPVPPPSRPAEPPSRWDQIRPLLEKAQALAADGDVRGAQMLVVKAMEMDPGEPQVWKTFKGIEQDLLIRAETFLADGQLPRALREFQFIISTNPESALGFNGVGQALLQLKNYDEAVAAFEKALVLEPGNARYRQALTRARSLQKASRAFERQGQQNVKDMIEGQPGTKKGP